VQLATARLLGGDLHPAELTGVYARRHREGGRARLTHHECAAADERSSSMFAGFPFIISTKIMKVHHRCTGQLAVCGIANTCLQRSSGWLP
jgi:hypothetical protein